VALGHAADRRGDPFDLRQSQRVSDGRDALIVEHVAVRADDAREAFAGELARRRPAIGRRRRVVGGRQGSAPDMDIAGDATLS
jgi:hypothetical protein